MLQICIWFQLTAKTSFLLEYLFSQIAGSEVPDVEMAEIVPQS